MKNKDFVTKIQDPVSINIEWEFLLDLKRALDIILYATKYDGYEEKMGEDAFDKFMWFNEVVSSEIHKHNNKPGFDKSTGSIDIGRLNEFIFYIKTNNVLLKAIQLASKNFECMVLDNDYSFCIKNIAKWIEIVNDLHNEWSERNSLLNNMQAA